MPSAARKGDKMIQRTPHCHAPIHPAAPVPTPVPHQGVALEIKSHTAQTVFINKKQAAILGSLSGPCMMPSCVPAGPGMIAQGSMTVLIEGMPAARVGDRTSHAGCVAPIPAPIGEVDRGGSPDVAIGG
jgi:uncharacterized Zn-binding protein involved in type VI secretion